MRALVTGGAGFIGSAYVRRVLDRHPEDEVVVLDDLSTGRPGNLAGAFAAGLDRSDVRRCGIDSAEAADLVRAVRPDVVMLLAAQMSVRVSMRDPVLDARVNLLGHLNLLEAARASGAGKVVFASSGGTIYGRRPADEERTPETAVGRPESFYGLTKLTGVEYLRLYRRHHGLEHVALALGNVYGRDRTRPGRPASSRSSRVALPRGRRAW